MLGASEMANVLVRTLIRDGSPKTPNVLVRTLIRAESQCLGQSPEMSAVPVR